LLLEHDLSLIFLMLCCRLVRLSLQFYFVLLSLCSIFTAYLCSNVRFPAKRRSADSSICSRKVLLELRGTGFFMGRMCLPQPAVSKYTRTPHYRFVFQHLSEPKRAVLVGVYAVTLDPLLSLYGIVCVTWYTRHLPKPTGVRFR